MLGWPAVAVLGRRAAAGAVGKDVEAWLRVGSTLYDEAPCREERPQAISQIAGEFDRAGTGRSAGGTRLLQALEEVVEERCVVGQAIDHRDAFTAAALRFEAQLRRDLRGDRCVRRLSASTVVRRPPARRTHAPLVGCVDETAGHSDIITRSSRRATSAGARPAVARRPLHPATARRGRACRMVAQLPRPVRQAAVAGRCHKRATVDG